MILSFENFSSPAYEASASEEKLFTGSADTAIVAWFVRVRGKSENELSWCSS